MTPDPIPAPWRLLGAVRRPLSFLIDAAAAEWRDRVDPAGANWLDAPARDPDVRLCVGTVRADVGEIPPKQSDGLIVSIVVATQVGGGVEGVRPSEGWTENLARL